VPLLGDDADPGEIAELALSHLWFRDDAVMARSVGREASRRGDSPELRVLDAEWLARDDRRGPRAGLWQLGQVLMAEPELFVANYARARLLYGTRTSLEQALSDVERAIRARPLDWPARRLRLNVLILLERWSEARSEAETLLASPYVEADTRLWADAALLAGALGRHEQGIREMLRYFESSALSPDEWTWMAKSLRTLGREREAIEAEEIVHRINHNRARYGHRHARWLELRGAIGEAVGTLQQVVRMDPGYEPARVDLARLTTDPGP
jgi:tetratricopeptide (TPR) repeat protein